MAASSSSSSCVGIHSSSLFRRGFRFCSRFLTLMRCAVAADLAAVDLRIDFRSET